VIRIDPIAAHARTRPSKRALVGLDEGSAYTWAELDVAVNRCAHWLIARLGPCSGERVATLAKNTPTMLILQFACARAGAIFVPLNWRLAKGEVAVLLADSAPALLFHDADFDVTGLACGTSPIADLATLVQECSGATPPTGARQPWEAPSTLLFTSGTSGAPKGVMISEANAYWGATNFMLGYGVTVDSVFLCDMPLFHTAGLFAASRTPILAGGTLYMSQGFDAAKTLSRIADPLLGITVYFSVPQMAQMIWNFPGFKPAMLQGLRVYATGGAPNPKTQIERFIKAGIPMSDGFGMTETGSVSGVPLESAARVTAKAGSIGLPFISIETQIVDETESAVPDGERGELWVRGPSVTKGYWNQRQKSASAFHDGWFKTGDIARRDADGFLFIVDRKKDMFISGGENVYPAEIEAVVAELREVAECAVIGIPSDAWGEVGCAHVILVAGQQLTAEDVIAQCTARLAKFKVPKVVIFAETIPRTASGKVQKHLLSPK